MQSSTHIMIYAHNNAHTHTETDRQTEPRVSTHISSHTHTQRERESVFCITSIARFIAISLSLLWFLHIFILTAFPLAIPSSFSHCPSFRVERNPLCLIHFFPSCFQWITHPHPSPSFLCVTAVFRTVLPAFILAFLFFFALTFFLLTCPPVLIAAVILLSGSACVGVCVLSLVVRICRHALLFALQHFFASLSAPQSTQAGNLPRGRRRGEGALIRIGHRKPGLGMW